MPGYDYTFPKRQLVDQHRSELIEKANIPRSTFKQTWSRLTSFSGGLLVPILVEEVYPGDHFRYKLTAYVRMQTPLFPVFSNQRVDTFFFFVPNRLVWTQWKNMLGEQDNPTDTIAYTVPYITLGTGQVALNDIYDHFGIPSQIAAGKTIRINALPARAYNLIYNQWFRDENLEVSRPLTPTSNGPDTYTDYTLVRRAKLHDYFTSCLPWPQKFTAPAVPVGGFAPITGLGLTTLTARGGPTAAHETGAYPGSTGVDINYAQTAQAWQAADTVTMATNTSGYPTVYADLSQATGVTINTFRTAFMIQAFLERSARGGTRYTEFVRAQFGVINPDFRLQRPEYIGGGSTPLVTSPIAQTTPTATAVLGTLGGTTTATGQHSANYAATEHGFIIGLINVQTELAYQQGLHRMWTRSSVYDYYVPAFAQLGEQAVLRKEIYCTGDPANDEVVFGYQERWHELRVRTSEVVGIFNSTRAGTYDAWHLAQKFTSAPTLGPTFLRDTPPIERIIAAGSGAAEYQYLADLLFERTVTRAMPMFGTPALLGRF